MKKTWVILLSIVVFTACYAPKRNCKKFKTGTFEFETYLNGELVKTTFTRNDTLEIDYFQGEVDSSSVRWINDCEYILTPLYPKNRREAKALHIKILTTDKNSYTFEFSVVGSPEKQAGTAFKVDSVQ